jgi:hypothetical protein
VAFFAYTPFLLEEICLKLFFSIISGLIKIGCHKLNYLRMRLLVVIENFDSIGLDRREFAV